MNLNQWGVKGNEWKEKGIKVEDEEEKCAECGRTSKSGTILLNIIQVEVTEEWMMEEGKRVEREGKKDGEVSEG